MSRYAQLAYQIFIFCLIVIIYGPRGISSINYTEIPKRWVRYVYLSLLFGFFLSAGLYTILIIIESGEQWFENIFRKPITSWKGKTKEDEQKEDEQKIQPSAFISFIAYPLMFYAFNDLATSLFTKKGIGLYGTNTFYNPFTNTQQTPNVPNEKSDVLIRYLLTTLSSFVVVFNYGSIAGMFFPEKWKTIGSTVLAAVSGMAGILYYVYKMHQGVQGVIPMGLTTTSTTMKDLLTVVGIMFSATLLIGYPVNPLLEWLRTYCGADGYWISIISSIATLLLARKIL